MKQEEIFVPGAPDIPGLRFRPFGGEADYAAMAAVQARAHQADGIDAITTAAEWRNTYENLVHCDPGTDTLFAEVYGALVAFGRVRWRDQSDGMRRFDTFGFVDPGWRRRGLGRAMLRWIERRAAAIHASLPPAAGGAILATSAEDGELGKIALLRHEGFAPLRYERYMRRSLDEPIPDAPLPAGFEFRPAQPEHYRAIWEADDRGFEDHWGHAPGTEQDYRRWLGGSHLQPELWRVIWHIESNRIAAQVLSFVDHEENERCGRRRGYTEDITTQREFRRMGLARAALCESMRMFRDMGFSETYLGTDSQNLTGSYRVYEWCGYRTDKLETTYSKALA
jgi:GNAT superfamily N-acetyltransferase